MADGAYSRHNGQGQLHRTWGHTRPCQADAADAGAHEFAETCARPMGDIEHVDVGEPDQLDTFAQIWRRRVQRDPSETTDNGDDALEGDALERPDNTASADVLLKRNRLRRQLREFLRAVPRQERQVTLVFERPDGTTRRLTRGQLTRGIERMRPRMRQIVRLAIEEHWPRQRVCEYLGHISLKTVERDQREALDLLTQL